MLELVARLLGVPDPRFHVAQLERLRDELRAVKQGIDAAERDRQAAMLYVRAWGSTPLQVQVHVLCGSRSPPLPVPFTASAAQEAQGAAEREQRTLQSLQKQRKHMAHAAETLRAESEALAAEVRLITKERDGLAEELGDTQTRLHKAHQAVEDADRANKDLLREHRDSAKLMADVQRLTQERNAARNAADRATRKAEAVERQLQEVGGRVASVETVSGRGLPACVPALRRSAIVCAVRRLSDVVECAGGVMVQETTRLVTELAATRKRMATCEEERDAAKQRLEGAQLELREALTTVRGMQCCDDAGVRHVRYQCATL